MVSSHRPAGFAGGAALLPVYGWDFPSSHSAPRWETRKTRRGRREVGRRRWPPGLLAFRPTVRLIEALTPPQAGKPARKRPPDVESDAGRTGRKRADAD